VLLVLLMRSALKRHAHIVQLLWLIAPRTELLLKMQLARRRFAATRALLAEAKSVVNGLQAPDELLAIIADVQTYCRQQMEARRKTVSAKPLPTKTSLGVPDKSAQRMSMGSCCNGPRSESCRSVRTWRKEGSSGFDWQRGRAASC
jgi:hypothetical protein